MSSLKRKQELENERRQALECLPGRAMNMFQGRGLNNTIISLLGCQSFSSDKREAPAGKAIGSSNCLPLNTSL